MILSDLDAMGRGYIARPEQLIENDTVCQCHGDGRTLSLQKLALPNGLAATVSWDRCMDITRFSYRGIPLAYLGRTDERNDPSSAFERRFSGGMLYTCGLLNVGPGDETQPTHGRIHLQAATNRSVGRTGDSLILRGEMRESALFGENLLLRRELVFPLDRAEIRLRDTLTNQTPHAQPYMLLYHINLGYPFLSEHLKLRLPAGTETTPSTPAARSFGNGFADFAAPLANAEELDFSHRLPSKQGICRLSAENRALGIRFTLRYSAATLPLLHQWRCLRSMDYVLGLEPANNLVNGRARPDADVHPPVLEPFASISTAVTISLRSH